LNRSFPSSKENIIFVNKTQLQPLAFQFHHKHKFGKKQGLQIHINMFINLTDTMLFYKVTLVVLIASHSFNLIILCPVCSKGC